MDDVVHQLRAHGCYPAPCDGDDLCPIHLAINEIEALRAALQFYADEDVRSVKAGILEGVSKRPATAALAGEILPDTANLDKAEELPAGLPECLFQHCPTLDKCRADGCRQPRPKESVSAPEEADDA